MKELDGGYGAILGDATHWCRLPHVKDGSPSTPLQTLPPDFCNHLICRYARTSYRALVRFCLPLVVAL